VTCQLQYLRHCLRQRIQRALDELPDTLDETYDRTLEEIGKQNWEYAHRLFHCVAAASRPLRVEELAEFLAFDFDTDSTPTFREDWREEYPSQAVLSTCSSLLAIVDVDGSSVIQFTHFSVKEYLTSKRLSESKETISQFHVSMTLAHTIIAQASLSVLLHIDEKITKDGLEKFPLAKYAAEHWASHVRFEGASSKIQDGMKRLFDPSNHHFSVWARIFDPDLVALFPPIRDGPERPPQARATPLHYAAIYGMHDIVKFLVVERSQDVDARGFVREETPLGVASRQGHSEVARVLLDGGADTTIRDKYDWCPLERSSEMGRVEVVRVLVENHADVNLSDGKGRPALYFASRAGEVAVCRLLLENGANANAKKVDDRTPLHRAGNEEVAQLLLEYGADPNARDNSNRTPLHGAMEWGTAKAALVLLENGVDVNARDARNQTPLHVASEEGLLDGVRLLLQHGADVHARDDEGRTPFQAAASASAPGSVVHEQCQNVMRLLLEHGAEDHRTQ
jgi:ankyrin repeat protein